MLTNKKTETKKKTTSKNTDDKLKEIVLQFERIIKSGHSAREKEGLIAKHIHLLKLELGY